MSQSVHPETSTSERRYAAAVASGGTSGEPIYALLEQLTSAAKPSDRVLDFGAGVGNLSRRLLARNSAIQLSAADIMACPADLHGRIEWRQCDLNEPLPAEWRSRFDWIVAAEIIEHLENPRSLFREFARLLKPGGRLLLSTPNNESYRALASLLFRGHFVAFSDSEYPAHITALLGRDLERIAAETGFLAPERLYSGHGRVPGVSMHWQTFTGPFLRGKRFSDNAIFAFRRSGP